MNESTQAEGLRTIPLSLIELNEGQLAGLPQNPRSIKKKKFEKLKKSINDYPEMLKYRSLLVYPLDNGHYILIGGNMRFRALQEIGYHEAPCIVIPKDTSVDRLQAYTIQDNNGFGEWDYDLLANEWDWDMLDNWGLDMPKQIEPKDLSDKIGVTYKIEITCDSEAQQEEMFNTLTGQGYECRILTL